MSSERTISSINIQCRMTTLQHVYLCDRPYLTANCPFNQALFSPCRSQLHLVNMAHLSVEEGGWRQGHAGRLLPYKPGEDGSVAGGRRELEQHGRASGVAELCPAQQRNRV